MSDDLISRAEAIDAIYHHFPSMTMDECRAVLHEVPTIEERKKGKWIESNLVPSRKGKPDGRLFICPECDKGWIKQDRSMEGINFCPNCGADMRGTDDDPE